MLLKDIITFRDDLYFEGAVQADWFYQPTRTKAVASSFVFHGPSTHAVAPVEVGGHGLLDTASFALKLAEKANGSEQGSPFTLAIAGYGTGKSHLAVTLSALLSGRENDPVLHSAILENVARADRSIAQRLKKLTDKPRLVLTLNGMRDFNLHYELLRTAEKSLKLYQTEVDLLSKLDKAKEIALSFMEHSFDLLSGQFSEVAGRYGVSERGEELRRYLTDNLDDRDSDAFAIVNEVYTAFNGHAIRMDEGVSASAVLDTLLSECCGTYGRFEGIVILFDEFGRYLEYVGANPATAGDSALQQIFESVQNAQGDIQFVGFIQSDIKSYLSRVDKSSNISRYIDRYDAGEKVYLSSNLETIFANLLEHSDPAAYRSRVLARMETDDKEWKALHDGMSAWLPLHGIWSDWPDFRRIILQTIYPLHPISTYLLCCLTDWLQNRSSLTLLSEKLCEMGHLEITADEPLPMIYPVDLLEGAFFAELLNAEEQGRQRSQFCILLNNILRKFDTKMSVAEKRVLLANLTLRVCRFHFTNRAELNRALAACANLTVVQVQAALVVLEDEYAVLSYDDRMVCFDFVADSVGANDFRHHLRAAKNRLAFAPEMLLREDILACAGVADPLQTNFSTEIGVQTNEWTFAQRLVHHSSVDSTYLKVLVKQLHEATDPATPKGILLWVYVEKQMDTRQIERLQALAAQIPTDAALCLFMLDDADDQLQDAILEYRVLTSMAAEDKGRFHRFYTDALAKAEDRLTSLFTDMKQRREQITADSVTAARERMNVVLANAFRKVYPKALPFDFDGFQNKSLAKASKMFCSMMKWILIEHMTYQSLKSQTVDVRNRVESLLGRSGLHSWRALNSDYSGVTPMNDRVRAVYQTLVNKLQKDRCIEFGRVIPVLTAAPYGMNDYAVFLMLGLLCENLGYTTKIEFDGTRYNGENWAELVLSDKKIDMRRLSATRLHLVDAAETESRFKMLFREIINNFDMTQVAELRARLTALEKEETVPETLTSDYALARNHLTDGEKALEKYEEAIAKLKSNLASAVRNKDAYTALQVTAYAMKIVKDQSLQDQKYVYNGEQKKLLVEYAQKGKKYAEEFFDAWIPNQRCETYGSANAYSERIERITKLMDRYGYHAEARRLRDVRDQELHNMKILVERQTLKEQCEIYLRTSVVEPGLPMQALQSLYARGAQFLEVYKTFDYRQIPALKKQHSELCKRLEEIQAAMDAQRARMQEIRDLVKLLQTMNDVQRALQRITALLGSGLDEEHQTEFEKLQKTLKQFVADTETFESCGDDPKRLKVVYMALLSAYPQDGCINLTAAIENQYQDHCEGLCAKEAEWVKKWLDIDPATMDQGALDRWKRSVPEQPPYLSAENSAKLDALHAAVEKELSEKKIEYIMMLYDRLSDSEKSACKKRMEQL